MFKMFNDFEESDGGIFKMFEDFGGSQDGGTKSGAQSTTVKELTTMIELFTSLDTVDRARVTAFADELVKHSM